MTDTAQLREALEVMEPWEFNTWLAIVQDAARKYLSLKEAGALIITPDDLVEKLRPLMQQMLYGPLSDTYTSEGVDLILNEFPKRIVDALRDAMPPEDENE